MIEPRTRVLIVCCASVLLGVVVCGCKEESTSDSASAPAAKVELSTADRLKVAAPLKVADAADGTTDKVIHRCAGCKLAMDGNAKHALTVGEYEMHFCSVDCTSRFSSDFVKQVMAIPAVTD
jgi:hypothetical protein